MVAQWHSINVQINTAQGLPSTLCSLWSKPTSWLHATRTSSTQPHRFRCNLETTIHLFTAQFGIHGLHLHLRCSHSWQISVNFKKTWHPLPRHISQHISPATDLTRLKMNLPLVLQPRDSLPHSLRATRNVVATTWRLLDWIWFSALLAGSSNHDKLLDHRLFASLL